MTASAASVPAPAASLVKSRMARTIRAIDGRVRHVETLLTAKPLREEIAAHKTDTDARLAALNKIVADGFAGLTRALAALADRVTALETAAAKKITKKKPAAVPATGTPEETPNNNG